VRKAVRAAGALLASSLILISGILSAPQASAGAEPNPSPYRVDGHRKPGLVLTFDDEFEGGRAAAKKWKHVFSDGKRWLSNEDQIYLDRDFVGADGVKPEIDPFRWSRGTMSIMARPLPRPIEGRRWSSGMLNSEGMFEFRYGYAEMRARVPRGKGLWPAFWMMRSGSLSPYGEIDVAEVLGGDTSTLYSTVHAGPDFDSRQMLQIITTRKAGFSDGFHVFAVDWSEKQITFVIDGVVRGWMTTPPDLKSPMYLLANLAVGGKWAGEPDGSTPVPAAFIIDYVRVWQRPQDR
jgi:beta-glucanase (GH16 family)